MADHIRLTQNAYIEGLGDLRKLVNPPDELVAKPWKDALTSLSTEGVESAQAAAPHRGGQTRKRIFAKVQKGNMPSWAAVRSRGVRKSAKYPRGYPYPRLLNYSPQHGHTGWFDRGVTPMLEKAEQALAEAGRAVAKKWGT